MSCRTEARVERNTARASPFSTCVPRAATATRLLNRVLGVYGYSGFRRESKITREVDHKRRWGNLCFGYAPLGLPCLNCASTQSCQTPIVCSIILRDETQKAQSSKRSRQCNGQKRRSTNTCIARPRALLEGQQGEEGLWRGVAK